MAVYLVVNSISLNIAGAWSLNRSLIRMFGGSSKRLHHQTMPYVHGDIAYPTYHGLTVIDLELVVKGKNGPTGTPFADEVEGKLTNLLHLKDNLWDLTGLPLPGELHIGDEVRVADMQVANAVPADFGATALVTFDLLIPAGVLEPSGS
jgi:hypothetical protein